MGEGDITNMPSSQDFLILDRKNMHSLCWSDLVWVVYSQRIASTPHRLDYALIHAERRSGVQFFDHGQEKLGEPDFTDIV